MSAPDELPLRIAREYRDGFSARKFGREAYDYAFLRNRGWDDYLTDSRATDLFLDQIPAVGFSISSTFLEALQRSGLALSVPTIEEEDKAT